MSDLDFSAAYETALRRLAASLIAHPKPYQRYVLPPGLNPLDPAVPVVAEMSMDGYETSGEYAVITVLAGGNVLASYLDLGELLRDLAAPPAASSEVQEGRAAEESNSCP